MRILREGAARRLGLTGVGVIALMGCTQPHAPSEPESTVPGAVSSPSGSSRTNEGSSGFSSASQEPSSSASQEPSSTPSPDPSPSPSSTQTAPSSASPSGSNSRESVIVQISRSGWDGGALVGAAVVPGVVQEDGTCTVFAESFGSSVSLSYSAQPDATSTICPEWSLSDEALVSGTWKVHVEYSSRTSSGISDDVQVIIP